MMDISREEYFFYEWLILDKKIDESTLAKLTEKQRRELLAEYKNFTQELNPR